MKTLLSLFLLIITISIAPADEKIDQAVEAAKAWLSLVDSKQYKKSWVEAAPFLKEKVNEEAWVKMIPPVRDPLGETKSRELIASQFLTELPGVPAGEYVVIQFKTSFQNKADAVETITPMKDDKGAWRVSGYFIK